MTIDSAYLTHSKWIFEETRMQFLTGNLILAVGCAERIFGFIERFAEKKTWDTAPLRGLLDESWAICRRGAAPFEATQKSTECLMLVPYEDDCAEVQEIFAEDAAASVTYVARLLEDAAPENAAWAAMRVIDVLYELGAEELLIDECARQKALLGDIARQGVIIDLELQRTQAEEFCRKLLVCTAKN